MQTRLWAATGFGARVTVELDDAVFDRVLLEAAARTGLSHAFPTSIDHFIVADSITVRRAKRLRGAG